MAEYKGCPLLIQSDTYPSLTIQGESHTRSYMLECIAEKCAAYRADSGFCDKFMSCVKLPPAQKEDKNA